MSVPIEKKETGGKVQVKFFDGAHSKENLEKEVNGFLDDLSQNGHSEVVDIRYNLCPGERLPKWTAMVIYAG